MNVKQIIYITTFVEEHRLHARRKLNFTRGRQDFIGSVKCGEQWGRCHQVSWEGSVSSRADRPEGAVSRRQSSSVGPPLGRESHKGPVYIRVRSVAIPLFLSFFLSNPHARADTRYPEIAKLTRVLSNGVSLRNDGLYATPTPALGRGENFLRNTLDS